MKFIKRLEHTAMRMDDAIFGWDVFRCRDYKNIDEMIDKPMELKDIKKLKPIFGYTIIIAINLKVVKFFKRIFLRTTI